MLAVVAFSAIVPLMTVVNYSVQDILGPEQRAFVGNEWFRHVLRGLLLALASSRRLPWQEQSIAR